jgi:Flp pilus assembly protein TadG
MGLTMPALIMAMAMGIEVSDWAAVKVELQRSSDAAALAGAYYYSTNSGQSGLAQKAATSAAYVAQLNGASGVAGGAANMTWNAGSSTLTDSLVTVQILNNTQCVAGTTCTIGVKATVSRNVSLAFGSVFRPRTSVTVSASSIAEVIPGSVGGPACILALQGDITGVTNTTDIGISGNVTVTATACALRSDASVTVNGGVNLTAQAIYAAGTYTVLGNSATVTAPVHTNAGQIPDPYLSDTALQNALSNAAKISSSTASISCGKNGCTGPSGCCTNITSHGVTTSTINPGSYGGLSADSHATVVMSPGLFEFRGDVSYNGGANLTANNVTIVTAGIGGNGSNFLGSSAQAMTAATTSGATNGQIAGVFFATSSSNPTTFGGSSGAQFTGLIYQPNGTLKLAGSAEDGSSGCAEVIAADVTITGNSELSANCTGYGLPTVNSLPVTSRISLVE